MLQFTQTDTQAFLILTLTENITLVDPSFLFTFRHTLTKAVVTFTLATGADQSNYKSRYNQFEINPSVTFAGQPIGEWHYTVSEVDGVELEKGKLMILRDPSFSFTKYNQSQTFSAYNG